MEAKKKRKKTQYRYVNDTTLNMHAKAQFEELCKMRCTVREIRAVMQMSNDTLYKWCLEEYGEDLATVRKEFELEGKVSLRRKSWKLAMQGNVHMLKWRLANDLGETDRPVQTEDDRQVTVTIKKHSETLKKEDNDPWDENDWDDNINDTDDWGGADVWG